MAEYMKAYGKMANKTEKANTYFRIAPSSGAYGLMDIESLGSRMKTNKILIMSQMLFLDYSALYILTSLN